MTDNAKHTQGPWVVEASCIEDKELTIVSRQNKRSVKVASVSFANPAREADANILTAAPELLEALRWTVECLAERADDEIAVQQIEIARAAIAKAEGLE